MIDDSENLREFYRQQGEQRAFQEIIERIKQNPHVTIDFIQHFLTGRVTNKDT